MTDDAKPPTVITVSASSLAAGRRSDDPPLVTQINGHAAIVKVIRPIIIVLVRALRTFLQTLLGALAAGMTGVIHAQDFYHLLLTCASISVAAGVISLLQNILELLVQFDQSHPTLAG